MFKGEVSFFKESCKQILNRYIDVLSKNKNVRHWKQSVITSA